MRTLFIILILTGTAYSESPMIVEIQSVGWVDHVKDPYASRLNRNFFIYRYPGNNNFRIFQNLNLGHSFGARRMEYEDKYLFLLFINVDYYQSYDFPFSGFFAPPQIITYGVVHDSKYPGELILNLRSNPLYGMPAPPTLKVEIIEW